MPKVSFVIPTNNRLAQLERLLASIKKSDLNFSYEIIVVDNASTDKTAETVRKNYPTIRIISSAENMLSSAARNKGAEVALGEYIFFVDDDNVLDARCTRILVEYFDAHSKAGLIAPLMFIFESPKIIWCAGGKLSKLLVASHYLAGQNIDSISVPKEITDVDYFPNAYMVRASLHIMHDSVNFPHNWAEQDFANRVRKTGHTLATVTDARTFHDVRYSNVIVTRISKENAFDQARSRIFYRRAYANRPLIWLHFFLVVLPLSTAYYIYRFASQKNLPFWTLARLYWKGTVAGLTQPIKK